MHAVNICAVDGRQKVILAEQQPQFAPLPALYDGESFLTEWVLTTQELATLVLGGRIRFWQFAYRFAPVAFEVVAAQDVLPLEKVQ